MAYDFTKAKDLVEWAKVQLNNPNYYQNGGIGRYDGKYRIFDCCGLFKCFMWHDYKVGNAGFYPNDREHPTNTKQRDLDCEGLIAEAKEKGTINTIPEIPGILVYQYGHMGIYIGNGEVIESTGHAYDGKHAKIYKTYFKGAHNGYKRDTWTHWFKSPYLTYEELKPIELQYKQGDKIVLNGYLYSDSKGNGRGLKLTNHVGVITITNNDYNTTKPYHIDDLGWVAEADIKPYVEIPPKTPQIEQNEPVNTNTLPQDKNDVSVDKNTSSDGLLIKLVKLILKFVAWLLKK